MNGWRKTILSAVSDFEGGSQPPKSEFIPEPKEGYVRLLQIRDFKSDDRAVYIPVADNTRTCTENDILIGRYGASVGQILTGKAGSYNVALIKTIPDTSAIFPGFFYHYLNSFLFQEPLSAVKSRSAQDGFSKKDIADFPILLPPLSEQKRIVDILDEAFDGIAKATANAQRNLANAQALFEENISRMFSAPPTHWKRILLEDACTSFVYGTSSKSSSEGNMPVLRMGNLQKGEIDWSDLVFSINEEDNKKYTLSPNDVLFNRTNSVEHVGKCAIYRGGRSAIYAGYLIRIGYDRSIIDGEFLNFYLNSKFARDYGKTVMAQSVHQANISGSKLKKYPFVLPSLEEQKAVSANLKQIKETSLKLQNIYRQKLDALTGIKQSLLHKAFTGQLTSSSVVPAVQKLESPMTANAKLTADVIILAHYRHDVVRRDKTFGHVKAQKILHLAESCANVPLGRSPIKDAAGPNDFAHMLRAEEWAESNGFFKFNQRDSGYIFHKMKGYNQLLSEAQERLKPFRQKLDKILGLLVPMDTQEAEVFATVHAAWNNLIVDRKPITDDAIIKEARDNWHQDKLKIPKEKFLKAIRLIRNEGLVPDGSAKPVRLLQEKLL